ncbi:MAG: hypothetical protein ABIN36_13300 [Ferruginibacter sp.]
MKATKNSRLLLVIWVLMLTSCVTKQLVYIDEWEGKYTLWEHNSCCDDQKPVMLTLLKKERDKYEWKLFFTDNTRKDTVYGVAKYIKNKLKFYLNNNAVADYFFVNKTSTAIAVFNMEYDNYYTEKDVLYISYYTRWDNFLIGYKNQNSLFSGTSFHFKKLGMESERSFKLTRAELQAKKRSNISD